MLILYVQCSKRYYGNVALEHRRNPRHLWTFLKPLCSNKQSSTSKIKVLKVNGNVLVDMQEIVNELNDYFVLIGSNVSNGNPPLNPRNVTDFIVQVPHRFVFDEICDDFVLKELKKLKITKSTGLDTISAKFRLEKFQMSGRKLKSLRYIKEVIERKQIIIDPSLCYQL